MFAALVLLPSAAPVPSHGAIASSLKRYGLENADEVVRFVRDTGCDTRVRTLFDHLAGASRTSLPRLEDAAIAYDGMRRAIGADAAVDDAMEACVRGDDDCAWVTTALEHVCGAGAPSVRVATGSTVHTLVRALAAGMADASRRRALQARALQNLMSSDIFSGSTWLPTASQWSRPSMTTATHAQEKAAQAARSQLVDDLVHRRVLDPTEGAALRTMLQRMQDSSVEWSTREYARMPATLRVKLLSATDASVTMDLLDYVLSQSHRWCGELRDRRGFARLVDAPHDATAHAQVCDTVATTPTERTACAKAIAEPELRRTMRSVAVIVVDECGS